jgi:hypothetical protein
VGRNENEDREEEEWERKKIWCKGTSGGRDALIAADPAVVDV